MIGFLYLLLLFNGLFFAFSFTCLRQPKVGGLKTESKMRVRERLYRPLYLSSDMP